MTSIKKKVAFHTLGCKLNFAETSMLSRSFPEDIFERVPANTRADIYIINTCTVTDAADKKCRQSIKKFISLSPGAFIAVTGCYAQLKPEEISSIQGVDLVLGMNEKFDIAAYLSDTDKKPAPEIHTCCIGLLADLFKQAGDLRAAAVHHHRVHPHQLQQHHVLGEGLHQMPLGHGIAAVFDDDGLVVETLDVGQRLGQDVRLLGGGMEGDHGGSGLGLGRILRQ